MGIKTAREGFTKDEILDILKRNVSLYKNEPEFVDYIVNLALFLIDQRLQAAGAKPPSAEQAPRGIVQMSAEDLDIIGAPPVPGSFPAPPPLAPPAPAPASPPIPRPLFPERNVETKPPSIAELRGVPPPTKPSIPPGMAASFKSSSLSKEPPPPPPPPEKPPVPTLRQLNSPAALTPPPQDERPTGPRIQLGGDQGRTRVYKVIRSYNAGESEKTYCPICGSDTAGESKCPNCGHLL